MSKLYHAVVWIDHQQAKVFFFNAEASEMEVIHSTHPHQHLHHKANSGDSGHALVDNTFLKQVTQAITKAGALLITGPANAKVELVAYVKQHNPMLAERISAVETLDHPTDGQLVAHGRSFFKADDRMHSQIAVDTR
jgi:stalled ribosome rescue protein Dom34